MPNTAVRSRGSVTYRLPPVSLKLNETYLGHKVAMVFATVSSWTLKCVGSIKYSICSRSPGEFR